MNNPCNQRREGVGLACSDASVKSGRCQVLERKTFLWPFSPAMPRGTHRHRRYFTTERLLFSLIRIGSVNCGLRPAIATTRTTGCSLSSLHSARLKRPQSGVSVQAGLGCVWNCAANSGNIRWSSRPRPVNRLQATSQPRRVMRGGSKSCALGSSQTKDRPVQGKLSLSPVKQSLLLQSNSYD